MLARRELFGQSTDATVAQMPPAEPSISVIMPAHNEEELLRKAVDAVVAGLRQREASFEVVISENGSVDATRQIAGELAAEVPEVRSASIDGADYGRALRSGFVAASGELVVNFDVDLVDFAFLDAGVELLRQEPGAAVVVGTKRGPGAEDRRAAGRRLITAGFSLVLRHGFGLQVSDTHGLKVLRRQPLEMIVDACRFGGDIFDTELVLRAERSGLGVRQIPIRVADLRPPRTSIVRRIPRSLFGLARLRLALWNEREAAARRP
jgi:glycosyltransferase AglD